MGAICIEKLRIGLRATVGGIACKAEHSILVPLCRLLLVKRCIFVTFHFHKRSTFKTLNDK